MSEDQTGANMQHQIYSFMTAMTAMVKRSINEIFHHPKRNYLNE